MAADLGLGVECMMYLEAQAAALPSILFAVQRFPAHSNLHSVWMCC
jgi:hypothetical protein